MEKKINFTIGAIYSFNGMTYECVGITDKDAQFKNADGKTIKFNRDGYNGDGVEIASRGAENIKASDVLQTPKVFDTMEEVAEYAERKLAALHEKFDGKYYIQSDPCDGGFYAMLLSEETDNVIILLTNVKEIDGKYYVTDSCEYQIHTQDNTIMRDVDRHEWTGIDTYQCLYVYLLMMCDSVNMEKVTIKDFNQWVDKITLPLNDYYISSGDVLFNGELGIAPKVGDVIEVIFRGYFDRYGGTSSVYDETYLGTCEII